MKTPELSPPEPIVNGLKELLIQNSEKRISVVGTTCTGKSTLLAQIPGARDQDHEIFPQLTPAEKEYICQVPWTEEIGETMTRLVRERVLSEAGRPVFGTVVIDCDFIILLKISDELLRNRASQRGVQFSDAKNMQTQLELKLRRSGIPHVEYLVG